MGKTLAAIGSSLTLLIALVSCSGDDAPPIAATSTRPPSTTTSTTIPASVGLVEAACAGELAVSVGDPIVQPALTEVSGAAVVPATGPGTKGPATTTWVLNDSGDAPRLYGIGSDGSFRTVDVAGADAIDWEDLAVTPSGRSEASLWIADTGGNTSPRTSGQIYRVRLSDLGLSAVGPVTVPAERIDVTFVDGPLDVEAMVVDGDGTIYLFSKEPGVSRIFQVDPPAAGTATTDGVDSARTPVAAEVVGFFAPSERDTTLVTGAALAPDGRTLAIRSYGSIWLYPIDEGQTVPEALAMPERRCRGLAGAEAQGEAVAFLPDGSGYVTIGEGADPSITSLTRGG